MRNSCLALSIAPTSRVVASLILSVSAQSDVFSEAFLGETDGSFLGADLRV
jgi:hypothetical protein